LASNELLEPGQDQNNLKTLPEKSKRSCGAPGAAAPNNADSSDSFGINPL
jgi:hypothetical protein